MNERRQRILQYVVENTRVELDELAAMVAATPDDLRRDLQRLEEGGLIRREHGLVIAASSEDMVARLAFHHDVKRRIARAALDTVADGDTIMIESGSCCALLADEVARNRRGCTIVTNSAFIADYVRRSPWVEVVLLGGEYQPESQVVVGAMAASCAASYFVDRFYIGIDGYTDEAGFTAKNLPRAEVVRAMAAQAKELVVVTESLKFPRRGAVRLVGADAVARVVTDDNLPEAIQAQLTASGIRVTKVAAGLPPRQ